MLYLSILDSSADKGVRSMVVALDGGFPTAWAVDGSASVILPSLTALDHGGGPAPSGSSIWKNRLTLRNFAEGSELRLITCIWIFDPG